MGLFKPDISKSDLAKRFQERNYASAWIEYISNYCKEVGINPYNDKFIINSFDVIKAFSYIRTYVDFEVDKLEIYFNEMEDGQGKIVSIYNLPIQEQFTGEIKSGRIVGNNVNFMYPINLLPMNMFIAGMIGKGKSNMIKQYCLNFKEKQIRLMILNFKGNEYAELSTNDNFKDAKVMDPSYVEIFRSPYGNDLGWINFVLDNFKRSGKDIRYNTKRIMLQSCKEIIEAQGSVKVMDLKNNLEAKLNDESISGSDKGPIETAFNIVTDIVDQLDLADKQTVPLENILEHDTVILMNRIDDDALQTFYAALILYWVYLWKNHYNDSDRPLEIIIDEAKSLVAVEMERGVRKIPIFKKMFNRFRHLSTGLILSDQNPASVVNYALNVDTYISFALRDKRDIDSAAVSLQANEVQKERLSNLPVGTAMVRTSLHPNGPFEIMVERAPEFKKLTDGEVDNLIQDSIVALQNTTPKHKAESQGNAEPNQNNVPVYKKIEEWEKFFIFVSQQADYSIVNLYDKYEPAITRYMGDKWKREKLLKNGLVEEKEVITSKKGRREKRLILTEKGRAYLNEIQKS